jgi:hypothetical protein
VKRRRILNQIQTRTTLGLPEKKMDISALMRDLYKDVEAHLNAEQSSTISFTSLVPGETKQDKIFTFVPLLHLTNARKVDLEQHKHFGEIWVSLAKKKEQKKKDIKKDKQPKEKVEAEEPDAVESETRPQDAAQEQAPADPDVSENIETTPAPETDPKDAVTNTS